MNEDAFPREEPAWSLAEKETIERLCRDFDRRWQDGGRPRIEDYLAQVTHTLRAGLLERLVASEVRLRRAAGDELSIGEYHDRFPGDGVAVSAGYDVIDKPRRSDAQSMSTIDVSRERAADTSRAQPRASNELVEEHCDTAVRSHYGRYELQRLLGQGGFGRVYLARDPRLQRLVALKVPRRKWLSSHEQADSLLREAQAAARLKHTGLVAVHDVQQDSDGTYIVQEYVDGVALHDWVRTNNPSYECIVQVMIEVADAVGFAHRQGFVHRDLKPANILVDSQAHPHVADFGLALHESDQSAHKGDVSGTVAYMSPEQLRGQAHHVDGRSDIWSIGVILYELLTGRRPFFGESMQDLCEEILEREAKPPRMINDAIPERLEGIVLKCLSKRVAERYATTKDLAHDLNDVLDPRRDARRRWWIGVGLAMLLVSGGLIGLYCARSVREGPAAGPSSVIPASARQPLRIESVEIQQLIRNDQGFHERHGPVLRDQYRLREGDAVQLRAHLSHPAYCYWIAFRPDGVEELCFPPRDDQLPPLTDEPRYPMENPDQVVYGLTDGQGLQVFAIIASNEPLPPYQAWRARRGTSPWRATHHAPVTTIRVHSGDWVEEFPLDRAQQTRGGGETLQVGSHELDDLVAWLRQDSQVVVMEVWALPVLPRGFH